MKLKWIDRHLPVRNVKRGMSLVELMVGITIGLFIVAAAVTLVAGQLSDNRRLTVELQVQQDLRATADIITRQLRRAGSQGVIGAQGSVTTLGDPPALSNGSARLTTVAGSFDEVGFYYYYNAGDEGPYGYRVRNNAIEAQMGGAWQQLTDPLTVKITAFTVTPIVGLQSRLPCPLPCEDGTSNCWPEVVTRELDVTIRGEAANDPGVVRELSSRVRLRNELVKFNDDPPNPLQICPLG